MKITADTNILIRAAVQDDKAQAQQAVKLLQDATLIAVPTHVLCEFTWVLKQCYKKSNEMIIAAIHSLMNSGNVTVDRTAIDAGLSLLEAGGDFADGVIAYEGFRMGATTLVSFDQKAVTLLKAKGIKARLA